MFRYSCMCLLILSIALILNCSSQTYSVQAQTTTKSCDIQQLSWMTGKWTRQEGNRRMEEYWTEPAGRTMVGLARTVVGNRTVDFEFLRILQTKTGKITYLASPGGRCPPTPFELIQLEGEHAVFENLNHDFPQRIIYRRDTDGTLHARIEGLQNGQSQHIEWSWPPLSSQ